MSSNKVNKDRASAPPPPAAASLPAESAADPAAPPQILDSAQIVQLLRHLPGVYQVRLVLSFPLVNSPFHFPSFPPWRACIRGNKGHTGISFRLVRASTRDSVRGSRLGHVRVSVRCSGRRCPCQHSVTVLIAPVCRKKWVNFGGCKSIRRDFVHCLEFICIDAMVGKETHVFPQWRRSRLSRCSMWMLTCCTATD